MSASDLSLVSTTNLLLMKSERNKTILSTKKIGLGSWSGKFSKMIGNNTIVKIPHIQLAVIATGTNFGVTISGIYSQVTGPRVSPKLPIVSTSPIISTIPDVF